MHELPRCPVTRKSSFESVEAASRWLASKAAEFEARPAHESSPRYAAECQHCPYVHVSARPPRRATLNRRGRSKSRKNRRKFGGRNG